MTCTVGSLQSWHDKAWARTREETDLYNDKKKKKKVPSDLGRHSLVLELRYTNYLELNVWYNHHILVLGIRFMIT